MKPSEVLEKERNHPPFPFVAMFGCSELESAASEVVRWLSENGDDWSVLIPLFKICREWDLDHGHPYLGPCKFCPDFAEHVEGEMYRVTELFIGRVSEWRSRT